MFSPLSSDLLWMELGTLRDRKWPEKSNMFVWRWPTLYVEVVREICLDLNVPYITLALSVYAIRVLF